LNTLISIENNYVYELNMLDINSLFTFGVYFPSIFIDEINVRK